MPKKSSESFLKILFLQTETFSRLRFCHFPLLFKVLFVYGIAEWQCIQCQIVSEIIGMSNVIVVNFRQQRVFWTFV